MYQFVSHNANFPPSWTLIHVSSTLSWEQLNYQACWTVPWWCGWNTSSRPCVPSFSENKVGWRMPNFNVKTFSLSLLLLLLYLLLWNVGYLAHLILEMRFSMLQMEKDTLPALLFLLCLISNGRECKLLTILDFWVDVFVVLPISSVCSKLLAQTEAVWSFVACLLPLMKSVYHPSQPWAVLIKIVPSARQVTFRNFNLVFHVLMDFPSPKKVAFFVVIFSVRKIREIHTPVIPSLTLVFKDRPGLKMQPSFLLKVVSLTSLICLCFPSPSLGLLRNILYFVPLIAKELPLYL